MDKNEKHDYKILLFVDGLTDKAITELFNDMTVAVSDFGGRVVSAGFFQLTDKEDKDAEQE